MYGGRRIHAYPTQERVRQELEMRDGVLYWTWLRRPAGYYKVSSGAHVIRFDRIEYAYDDILCIWRGEPLPPRKPGPKTRKSPAVAPVSRA